MGHPYVCPHCRVPLRDDPDGARCDLCFRAYPIEDGIIDFSEGKYYDNFAPEQSLTSRETSGLVGELDGANTRAAFYLDRLRAESPRTTPAGAPDRDCWIAAAAMGSRWISSTRLASRHGETTPRLFGSGSGRTVNIEIG